MTISTKPPLPAVSPKVAAEHIEQVKQLVQSQRNEKGEVSIRALTQALQKAGFPMESEYIRELFRFSEGEGYSYSAAQVERMMNYFAQAQTRVYEFAESSGNPQVVDPAEYEKIHTAGRHYDHRYVAESELPEAFALSAYAEAFANYEQALTQWRIQAQETPNEVARRQAFGDFLSQQASKHAQTPEGAQALTWLMRSHLVDRQLPPDAKALSAMLKKAENTPVLAAIANAFGARTLSDGEVAKLLSESGYSGELNQAADQLKAKFEPRYEQWLKGAELPQPDADSKRLPFEAPKIRDAWAQMLDDADAHAPF